MRSRLVSKNILQIGGGKSCSFLIISYLHRLNVPLIPLHRISTFLLVAAVATLLPVGCTTDDPAADNNDTTTRTESPDNTGAAFGVHIETQWEARSDRRNEPSSVFRHNYIITNYNIRDYDTFYRKKI